MSLPEKKPSRTSFAVVLVCSVLAMALAGSVAAGVTAADSEHPAYSSGATGDDSPLQYSEEIELSEDPTVELQSKSESAVSDTEAYSSTNQGTDSRTAGNETVGEEFDEEDAITQTTTLNELQNQSLSSPPDEHATLFADNLQTAAPWPGQAGGPDNWVPLTDRNGFVIRNAISGQNQPWLRMSSGEPATGTRGQLPTVHVASDGENAFFRQRTLDTPYQFSQGQWQNQGYHLAAVATEQDGAWETTAFIGMHINRDGEVFIVPEDGSREVIYSGNRNVNQAQGVQVTRAPDGNDGGYWTDVQVPISEIQRVANIDGDTQIRFSFGTATQPNSINRDYQNNAGQLTFNNVLTTSFNTISDDYENISPVELTGPENGETVTADRPTITGTTSTGGGVLEIYVNDQLVQTINPVGQNWEYELSEEQALADGDHTVRATLIQDGQTSTTQTNTFTVDTAEPLEITSETLGEWTVDRSGYSETLQADGGTEPYSWSIADGALPPGLSLSADGEIIGTPTAAGTYGVTVRVTDDLSRTSTREYTITINELPTITSPPPEFDAGVEGVAYREAMTAVGGTEPYQWDLSAGELPPGLSLDAVTGEIAGTPTAVGTFTFTVRLTDEAGAVDEQEYSLTINDGLTVTTRPLADWTVGQEGYGEMIEVAGGTAPYSWTITAGSLPDGLTLDPSTGEISGTPTESGTFSFTVTVEDDDGTAVSEEFAITINDELAIPEQLISDGTEDVAYSQQLTTTGGTGVLTWMFEAGELPPGVSIDENGFISGTPTEPGEYTFSVRVTDETGATATREFAMTVSDGLAIPTATLAEWTVGQNGYDQTIEAIGGTAPYEWTITQGDLPDGLTLDEGTGRITGTPTQAGSFPITVAVTDDDGTQVSREYTIFVNDGIAITSDDELRSGVAGITYEDTLLFEGGIEPVTWELVGGELPPGLELDTERGDITGTPTAAGTYGFTVQVTDATGSTDTKTVSITIGDGLTVATSTLPDWTVNVPYSERIEGVGGTEPYEFSVTDGSLPDGLSLDSQTGQITGVPTAAGSFTFDVTIEDDDGSTATETYTITIGDPVEIVTPETLPSGVEGVSYSTQLDSVGGTQPVFWQLEDGKLPPGLTLEADGSLSGVISGTPELAGTYTFTASVTDAAGSTTERTFTIEITDGLAVETADLDPWTVNQDGYSQFVLASGGTEPREWSASSLPDGLSIDAETGEISGTPTQTGTFTVIVQVTDADGTVVTQELELSINDQPTLISPVELSSGVEGVVYAEQLLFEGGTGDLTFENVGGEFPPGLDLDPDTGEISGTPTQAGTYTFTVQVTDETGATSTQEFTIVVGDGLSITTTTLDAWTVGQDGYSQLIEVAGGTEPYAFSVTEGALPNGLSLDPDTGAITGTPTESGEFTFTVRVTDEDNTAVFRTFTVTINDRPEISSPSELPDGTERVSYSEQLTVADGTEPLEWRLIGGNLPNGLTLDENGLVSGTPTQAGTFTFTVEVTDASGATTTKQFGITVSDGLTIGTTELDQWTVGQEGYSQFIETTGGTEPYVFSATGLPDGLSIDSETGEISGTPTETGTFTVTVQVIDEDGTVETQQLVLTINEQFAFTSPTDLRGGVDGVEYTQQLEFTGGTEPLTWAITDGALPDGLTLDPETGLISGTPTEDGEFTFTVEVTDASGATTTQTFTLVVGEGLTLTTATLNEWTVDQPAYTQLLEARGGTLPYTWTIVGGNLPDGLELDTESGIISGTPTQTGTFTITVEVTDTDGSTDQQTLELTINEQPNIDEPDEFADVAEGVAYSQQLTVADGTGPFSWTVTEGELPPGLSLDPETGLISGTPTLAGEYTFTVEVTDEAGATTTQEFTITITDGLAVEMTEIDAWTVDQDGFSQFIEVSGGTEPYTWSVDEDTLPAGLTLDPDTGELSGTPTQTGTFTFTVEVTDADGTVVQQTFTLTINDELTITAPETLDGGVEGVEYSETVTITDGTGPFSFAISDGELSPGLELDESTGEISGIPTEAGTYTFTVEVTDASGATTTETFTITVGDGLTITTATLNEWTVDQPNYADIVEVAGGTEPYSWAISEGALPPGLELDERIGAITGTPTETGAFTFTIQVTDEDGTVVETELTITINEQPTVEETALPRSVQDVSYSEQLFVADGTGPFTWALIDGDLPDGLTLDPETGIISGSPTEAGEFTFTVEVTDARGATSTQTFTILVDDGLAVTADELDAWTVDQDGYSQFVTVAGGTEPYAWTVSDGELPPGLELNEETGEISGTPTEAGEFTFTVQVTDADGTVVTQELTITINEQPTLEAAEPATAVQDVAYSQQLVVADGTAPFTWELADGELPDGLTLDPETGEISGTPTEAGEFTFTVQVTDASGVTSTQTYTIVVGDRLTITTTALEEWTVDQDGYSQTVAVSGGTEPYEWAITDGALPDGLTLNPATGEISGTPTQAGTFTFTVEVTDEDGTVVTQELTITINEEPQITAPETLDRGVEGVVYSETVTVEDGTGPFTFTLVDGDLPPGLELDPETGEISGTPTTAGTYAFTVEVTDASGATTTQIFTITVGDGLTVTTATLDSWTVDQAGYEQTLEAAGGTEPYEWAVSDGELPPGLTLYSETGVITGTPTEAGEFAFTVQVTDADGTVVTQELTITINEQPAITTDAELPGSVAGVSYSEQLTFEGGTEPITFALTDGALPAGLTLDENGLISGTPTESGTFTFTVTATDASGATTTQTFTIVVGDALAIETTELDQWTVDQDGYSQFVTVAGGTEPYQWELVGGLPEGLTLDTETGEISGTPTESGIFTVTVTVRDADGSVVTQELELTINDQPEVTAPETLTGGVEGVTYEEQLTATGGTGELTWTLLTGELPPGLELDESGLISGTPTEAGTYTFTVELTDETGATTTETFTITVGDGLTITTATLDAWTVGEAGYSDRLESAGGTPPVEWAVVSGSFPNGLELDPETGEISGTPTVAGTFTFTVSATDADGTVVTQELTITVNEPPQLTSDAELADGVERVAYSEQLEAADGTGPFAFAVIDGELPDGLTLDAETGVLSGTPTQAGTYVFTVELTDESGATTTRAFSITITDGLAIETGALDASTVDEPYSQSVAVTGGTEPYTWTAGGLPDGLTIDPDTGEISGTPEQTGTFTVTVEVIDGDGTTVTQVFELTINDKLTITAPDTLDNGVAGVEYTGAVTTSSGTEPFTFEIVDGALPAGLELDETTGEITGTPTEDGEFTFTVRVTDASGATTTQTFTHTIGEGLSVTTTTLDAWTVDQPAYTQLLGAQGGTLPYTWAIVDGNLPEGLELDDKSGVISGTPTQTGTFTITVEVTDTDGSTDQQTLELTINDRPAIGDPDELTDVAEGVAYSQQLVVADGTGPFELIVSDGELPPGLTLDPETGLISGTPTAAGEYTFTVEATDEAGALTTREYTIVVTDGLAVETTELAPWTVAQDGYSQTLDVSGGTEPYTWQISRGSLPEGLTLDPETGEISGTPTQAGNFRIIVRVTDADGTTASQQLRLRINRQARITAPTQLHAGVVGVEYSDRLTRQGGTGPFTWSVTAGDLPSGLSLDAETARITGTPTEAGTFTMTVQVTDASGVTTTQDVTITIGEGLTVTTTTVPSWTVDRPGYGTTVQAAGGTQPYSWTVSDGTLPPGLDLDAATGEISGSPTQTGTFTFTVQVTDADGTTATRELTITITDQLAITTTELPDGDTTEPYSQQFESSGGTDPVAWEVVAGSLPPGLTLDSETGLLSGTPTQAGIYTFTVRATDRTGATDTREFEIAVIGTLPPEEPPAPPDAPGEPDPEEIPPEIIEPGEELDEPVDDIGGIELVDARLEQEPVNSIRGTSIVTLRNNGTETRNVTVEHRLDGEIFSGQRATLGPGQTAEFRANRTLTEPGSYRFSFTYVTESRDGILTRTLDAELGTIEIEEEPTEDETAPECPLFGYGFGAYGICWYWWVLIDGLIAAMMSYLVQTRVGGVRRLVDGSPAGRHLERAAYMLPRLLAPYLAGALVALGVGIVLYSAGVAAFVQFLAMAVAAAAVGGVLGYLRVPDLAERLSA